VEFLKHPEEFVRNVLKNMEGYFRECQVRLARDSTPSRPDYLVEMLFYDEEDDIDVTIPQSIAVFVGRNHSGDLIDAMNSSRVWSTQAMKFEEVQMLLGDIRAGLR
jgi:hypothetical protein